MCLCVWQQSRKDRLRSAALLSSLSVWPTPAHTSVMLAARGRQTSLHALTFTPPVKVHGKQVIKPHGIIKGRIDQLFITRLSGMLYCDWSIVMFYSQIPMCNECDSTMYRVSSCYLSSHSPLLPLNSHLVIYLNLHSSTLK